MNAIIRPRRSGRIATALELISLLTANGRWWLLPFLFVLFATSVLLVVVQVLEYAAPFLYTVF